MIFVEATMAVLGGVTVPMMQETRLEAEAVRPARTLNPSALAVRDARKIAKEVELCRHSIHWP